MSLLEFGEEALEGRYEVVSRQDQVTGRCYGCHMPLVSQIFSQIYPEILDKAGSQEKINKSKIY